MILVTVGTHHQGFNRLVEAADAYAKISSERVVIQKGTSTYIPKYAEYFKFVDYESMKQLMLEARIIVMHAAAGAILLGLQMEKPIVLAPRLKIYREHYNDHQIELTQALCNDGKTVECIPITKEGLDLAINKASSQIVWVSGPGSLVENLSQYLSSINGKG